MNWRIFREVKPEDGQDCITTMKHGVISGCYNANEKTFSGYYWGDLEWSAYKWIPTEEALADVNK